MEEEETCDDAKLKSCATLKSREQEIETLKKQLRKVEFERDLAQRYVGKLKNEVAALNAKLSDERQEKQCHDSKSDSQQGLCSRQHGSVQENKSLKAVLEETAQEALSTAGLVYDDRTSLYYDWRTGFYYDPNSHLYYDNEKGVYYYFDEQIKMYKFHSLVQFTSEASKTDSEPNPEHSAEDGEDVSSTGDSSDEGNPPGNNDTSQIPCVRAMVVNSTTLKRGTLFIITCKGCTVGREKGLNHLIRIPDVEVSKEHCAIEFDVERRQYFVHDLGSRNGTFLNQRRLSQSKDKSTVHVLTHGDNLLVGATELLLHIHPALDTCDGCEPGQIQALQQSPLHCGEDNNVLPIASNERGAAEGKRRKEMKRLKRAYCLEGEDFREDGLDTLCTEKYKNRADIRRTKVGSDTLVEVPDEQPSSVHRPIDTENKGRQMLEKMGWKEGQGLGRDGGGLREPVVVQLLEQSRGLGAGLKRSLDDPKGKSRSHVSAKMMQRFK